MEGGHLLEGDKKINTSIVGLAYITALSQLDFEGKSQNGMVSIHSGVNSSSYWCYNYLLTYFNIFCPTERI